MGGGIDCKLCYSLRGHIHKGIISYGTHSLGMETCLPFVTSFVVFAKSSIPSFACLLALCQENCEEVTKTL